MGQLASKTMAFNRTIIELKLLKHFDKKYLVIF